MLLLRQLLLATTALAIGVIAKAKENASDNLAKMVSLTDKFRGVIPLDDKLFSELTSGPRDYTSAILLTALEPKYGCALCREFQPDYALIGKSWVNKNSGDDRNRVFFGVLDFGSGRATFQKVHNCTISIMYTETRPVLTMVAAAIDDSPRPLPLLPHFRPQRQT